MRDTFSSIGKTLKMAYKLSKPALFLTIINSVLDAVRPYVTVVLSAYILDGLSAGEDWLDLIKLAAIGVGIYFAVNASQKLVSKQIDLYIDISDRDFEMECGKKTLNMDYELIESPKVNDIRNRIKANNSRGAGFANVFYMLGEVLNNIFWVIAAFAVLYPLFTSSVFKHWSTALFFIGLFSVSIIFTAINSIYVNKKQSSLYNTMNDNLKYFGYFIWGTNVDYRHGKDFRVYDAKGVIEEKFKSQEPAYKKWVKEISKVMYVKGMSWGIANGILQGGSYLFVVLRAIEGDLSIGSVVLYATAMFNFSESVCDVLNNSFYFGATTKRQQDTLEYLNVPNVLKKGSKKVEKSDDGYEIEFKNVSFKYQGNDNYALRNLSMKLHIGQRLAVVGMNGSGKTTMIKLLCRLYDPTEGEITLNGVNIKEYDYEQYMKLFGVVFQDFKLFSFSLGQNVAAAVEYDADSATDCLSKAGFGERLSRMPKGCDTPLYKDFDDAGVEISGGEAQKTAIARALYKDAPFIVLDEPTAALDPIAEYEIYAKFNEIISGKTAIYISHRLSSCRFCHDIAVFHEGALVQRGSHDALVNDDGKYKELWNAQAQYYAETA